jgi:hypothetical protein
MLGMLLPGIFCGLELKSKLVLLGIEEELFELAKFIPKLKA